MSQNKLPLKEQVVKMRRALAKAKLAGKGDYRRKGFVSLNGRGDYSSRRGPLVGRAGRLRGRGNFFNDAWDWGRGAVRSTVGVLNDAAKGVDAFGKLFGKGDYHGEKVIAPNQVPLFENNGRVNSFVYKEYLGDIYSSVDFSATTFHLNPGLGNPGASIELDRGVFPWLSRVAQQYEEYRITGCVFYYIPTSSDAVIASATNGSLGSVSIASEYNSSKEDFSTLTDMLNHQYSVSKKPSECIAHPIECERKERPTEIQYIRSDSNGISGSELLHYDLCKTTVAVQGNQTDGEILGQLWVTYRVELLKPVLEEQADSPFVLTTRYQLATDIVTSSAYFGSTYAIIVPSTGSNFALTLGTATITFPDNITSGVWCLQYYVTGASTTLTTALTATMTTNCSAKTIFSGATSSSRRQAAGAVSTTQFLVQIFTITGPGAVITLSGGTMPGTITAGDLLVSQLNYALTSPEASEHKRSNFWRPTRKYPVAPWMKELRASREAHRSMDRQDMMEMFADLLELKRMSRGDSKQLPSSSDDVSSVQKMVQLYESKEGTSTLDDSDGDEYEDALEILKARRAEKLAMKAKVQPEEKKAASPASSSKKGSS